MDYPIKFKAAILEKLNSPLVIDEVTFNGPLLAGQVLVRIYYSGICGKQVEEIKGLDATSVYIPHMLGHEGSGVVVDIGPGVKKVRPADQVVLHWFNGSGIKAETPLYTCKGKRINAGLITTFNEYGVISENRLTPIPKNCDLSIACLFGCAVSTGLGLVFNEARMSPDDSLVVFGCGGVGLSVIQAAAIAGCKPIIAVDKNPGSLALAARLGASHAVNVSTEEPLARIAEITANKGANYVIVALGDPRVIEVAARASSFPGYVFLVGVPPLGEMIKLNAHDIHRGRTLLGSCGGKTVPERDINRYIRMYESGQLKLKELISKTVTLDRINDGITLLSGGNNVGRCLVEMDHNGE